jgi:hypothetical protein
VRLIKQMSTKKISTNNPNHALLEDSTLTAPFAACTAVNLAPLIPALLIGLIPGQAHSQPDSIFDNVLLQFWVFSSLDLIGPDRGPHLTLIIREFFLALASMQITVLKSSSSGCHFDIIE